jgi:hypothetical protein
VTGQVLLSLLFLAASYQPSNSTEASLACLYRLFTEAHETIIFCGESLDVDHENQYAMSRELLKEFINKNTRADSSKIRPGYDEAIRQHLTTEGTSRICQSQIYSTVRKSLLGATTQEQVEALRQRLATVTDPDKGECF